MARLDRIDAIDRCDGCRDAASPCCTCNEAAELKAHAVWEAYCCSGRKPIYVPERPDVVFADAWSGWQHWLAWSGVSSDPGPLPKSFPVGADIPELPKGETRFQVQPVGAAD